MLIDSTWEFHEKKLLGQDYFKLQLNLIAPTNELAIHDKFSSFNTSDVIIYRMQEIICNVISRI